MSRPHLLRAAFMLGLAACSIAFAHDGDQLMLRDAQVPWPGRIWNKSSGENMDISFPSNGVELLSWLPITSLDPASTSASTVEGYVSPSGKEYAVIGISGGTAFVDVTDPGNATLVKFIPSVSSLWRDIQLYFNYCYTVSEGGGGIQVIDMSGIDSGSVSLVTNINTPGSASTHTLGINKDSGFLYRCGGGSTLGLRIYSLVNPASPSFVTTALTGRYIHECQVVTYTSGPYAGKEIAFCYSDAGSGGGSPVGIDILDVTNKAAIIPLSFTSYPNARFSHQGWLSPDKHYLYQDDELDEQQAGQPTLTRVFDVSNLSAPVFVNSFGNGLGAIDHNQYTKGNLLFQSNYRSGLRVWDTTVPTAPTEIASFDTYPPDNNPSFNGLWDNYPYLPSGIVLGSDIEKGLFVWRLGQDSLAFSYPSGNPALLDPAGAVVPVIISNLAGTLQPGTAKLSYSTGGPYTAIDLVSTGGNTFNAVFPPIPCLTTVKYYLTAQTTTGITVKSPSGAPANYFQGFMATATNAGQTDTIESDTGWTIGAAGDNATTGIWVRGDPIGTSAQPEDDHTPAGSNCFFTGQGTPGGNVGEADVDGGSTTLTSAAFDATAGSEPYITYWRWYSNNAGSNPGTNVMPVSISNNNGATWVPLESVSENAGAWVLKAFRIADFVPPTSQVKLRFIAADLTGAVVEAAVDDAQIVYYDCTPVVAGDITGDGLVNIDDLLAVINAWGTCPAQPNPCPADIVTDGLVNIDDLLFVINHWS